MNEGAPENKWPNMNEETALRKLLTGNKTLELRNLGAPAHDVKCKLENQLKKMELSLVRETN
jgi:hypothetical protein